jgi:hypothetical protein
MGAKGFFMLVLNKECGLVDSHTASKFDFIVNLRPDCGAIPVVF